MATANEVTPVCGYGLAWIGSCKQSVAAFGNRCEKHKDIKCASCGEPATHECSETFEFVCGAPLCGKCEHEIAEDGTNGGSLKHCRKDSQKHQPWYMRGR